jgi:hypothetical protein
MSDSTLAVPSMQRRPMVDVDALFDEVASELGLDGPPAPAGERRQTRLRDARVTFEQAAEEVRKVTEMQRNVTLSSAVPRERAGSAAALGSIDAAAEPELHRHMDELYHPAVPRTDRTRAAALITACLLALTMLAMAWTNDVLNPLLPGFAKHTRPSVQEYLHGRAR